MALAARNQEQTNLLEYIKSKSYKSFTAIMALRKLFAIAFCFCLSGMALAEEASILRGAVVDSTDVEPDTVNRLIDGNFQTGIK